MPKTTNPALRLTLSIPQCLHVLGCVASVGLGFFILLFLAYPVWGDGFKLPKIKAEQLSKFSPDEWMTAEIVFPDGTSQIKCFVEGGWKTSEDAAKIAEKRRSLGNKKRVAIMGQAEEVSTLTRPPQKETSFSSPWPTSKRRR